MFLDLYFPKFWIFWHQQAVVVLLISRHHICVNISTVIFLKYVYVLNIPSYFLDILTSKVLLSILLPGASRQAKWSPYPLPDVLGWASADVGIFFLFSVLTALYFFTQPNINVNIYAQNIHVCFSYSCIYLSILVIISHTLCKNPILVC